MIDLKAPVQSKAIKTVMSLVEVAEAVGVCTKTIRKWEKEGSFPEWVGGVPGVGCVWLRTEVMSWIARCELAGAGLVAEAAALAALPVLSVLWQECTEKLMFTYWSDKELVITQLA